MPDRAALTGTLFVLKTGLPWEYLPAEMGRGCGLSCWRRRRHEWQQAGVWSALHRALLEHLDPAGQTDWSRASLDSSQRLGRHRWIVERTHAWMARLRRLTIRYERRDPIHLAFTLLGCALVCLNQITRFC